jgi:hypothetical protein
MRAKHRCQYDGHEADVEQRIGNDCGADKPALSIPRRPRSHQPIQSQKARQTGQPAGYREGEKPAERLAQKCLDRSG